MQARSGEPGALETEETQGNDSSPRFARRWTIMGEGWGGALGNETEVIAA